MCKNHQDIDCKQAEEKNEEQQAAQEAAEQSKVVKDNQQEESFKDQYLRLNADFQNFKKRVEKERIEWMTTAQASVLEKVLPIVDEFDRAFAALEKSEQHDASWLEGFKLVYKNLQKAMTDLGVEEIKTDGEFNPDQHEALIQVDSADHASGAIVQVLAKGYMLKGKVIKHAKVSVAK
ncbi:MAG: nucleotide exchange factor GrpE [Epsilonproteobacteria bacterium]|nr:nucleotide exchange factor GrpE [Campylobacterota bacterium]